SFSRDWSSDVCSSDLITELLNHLFDHARRRGAAALHGRMEPRFMQALSDRYSIFHDRASSILFHARNPAAKAALLAGDGFLTRRSEERRVGKESRWQS